jgi:hypothetical protein
MTPEDTPQKAAGPASWTSFLVPLLVVTSVAFAWLWLTGKGGPVEDRNSAGGSLEVDSVYYVFISEIELFSTNPEEAPWDSGDAPDIRYRLAWQDVTIHESEKKENSLIGEWSGVREGALGKLLGEDKLNAGKLRAAKEGTLRIEVEDVDALTPNDPAGTVELKIMSLQEGVNDLRYDEKTEGNAIKRLLIRLVAKDQPMEDIVRKMR